MIRFACYYAIWQRKFFTHAERFWCFIIVYEKLLLYRVTAYMFCRAAAALARAPAYIRDALLLFFSRYFPFRHYMSCPSRPPKLLMILDDIWRRCRWCFYFSLYIINAGAAWHHRHQCLSSSFSILPSFFPHMAYSAFRPLPLPSFLSTMQVGMPFLLSLCLCLPFRCRLNIDIHVFNRRFTTHATSFSLSSSCPFSERRQRFFLPFSCTYDWFFPDSIFTWDIHIWDRDIIRVHWELSCIILKVSHPPLPLDQGEWAYRDINMKRAASWRLCRCCCPHAIRHAAFCHAAAVIRFYLHAKRWFLFFRVALFLHIII